MRLPSGRCSGCCGKRGMTIDRSLELKLMDELIALKQSKELYLQENIGRASFEHYRDPDYSALEQERVFRRRQHVTAHVSELREPGDFRRIEIAGLPILVTRGKDGVARAFLNVCRHRGAQLVSENTGCQHRFTCPCHAWTYASSSELIRAPHFKRRLSRP